jgi:uncharacterized membrane protein YtjA (UPF0391 family)
MLKWALVFLVIALIAGVLGFGGLAGNASDVAKILCMAFVIMLVLSLFTGRRPRVS